MAHHLSLRAEWGRRIREARKAKGLSVVKLAQVAGIDPGNLSRVERGVQGTSDLMRIRIATALGTSVDELFDYDALEREAAG